MVEKKSKLDPQQNRQRKPLRDNEGDARQLSYTQGIVWQGLTQGMGGAIRCSSLNLLLLSSNTIFLPLAFISGQDAMRQTGTTCALRCLE